MFESILFYLTFALILLFISASFALKNIFHSLLSAMAVFVLTSVLFYMLGSEYNAIIQFAIYGFAVPVIIALAVMFTERNQAKYKNSSSDKKIIIILTGAFFILSFTYLVLTSYAIVPDGFNITEEYVSYDNLSLFSSGIYTKYVFAFELFSAVLTLIAAGLTIFKRGKNA